VVRLKPDTTCYSVFLLLLLARALFAQAPPRAVYSAEVDAIIHPASAQYMIDAMDRADAEHAELLVFTLRTPGGLVDSTRDIIRHMLAAKTPIAIWVGPAGTRAASAGFILTIAADVAAMAPGTNIGAAHPVSGSGQAMDDTMAKKAAEDVAAYVRSLAAGRHRNVEMAEQAVNSSKAFSEQEALKLAPPLIDLIATDIPDLLQKLDGRSVTRFDGSTVVLHTSKAPLVGVKMNIRQRVLSAIAHPNVAYLLMTLGTLGLTIELWSPGAILPGVAGGVSLLLAFFALQILPTNAVGLLLLLFGLTLFALEIKLPSFGLLTVGGITSLIFGSMMLFDSTVPELQLSLRVVVPVVLGFTAIAAFLVRLALTAQRRPPVSGREGLLNEAGEAITSVEPDLPGRVRVHGEIWRAVTSDRIQSGDHVRVSNVEGLTLTVRKE
jgi:membrane-bound serine protease (ClpP class)